MKKKFKGIIAALVALVIAVTTICIAPLTAQAIGTPQDLESTAVPFWADPENSVTENDLASYTAGTTTAMTGAVGVFARSTSSTNYYLFLPSDADCTNLKVWFNASTATVDGTPVVSGQKTDVFSAINAGGVSHTYSIVLGSRTYNVTAMKSGEVGAVYIDTTSGSMRSVNTSSNKTGSETGTIMVVDADGTINYNGTLEKINGRGNGTWDTSKEPYKYKMPYNIKLAVSTSLMGLPKAKKWCLLANVMDETLIKNQLTYDFADYIGVKYQPRCKPVDVYINHQYYGSYQLSEKVEIKSNRINVNDAYENLEIANGTTDSATGITTPADLTGTAVTTYNPNRTGTNITNLPDHSVSSKRYSTSLKNPTDITGGYLFELEISQRWVEENAGFCAYNRQGWVIKSCDYATKEMVDYSYDLLYAMGSAVYNGGTVPSSSTTTNCSSLSSLSELSYGPRSITNPAPASQYQGKKWNDILDADSAVKYYWTQEYFKNMDSSTSSTYFYKDSDSVDSKVYAGPMWDMDNSIGYDRGSDSRWGHSWTSSTDWFTKNARLYRWRSKDSTTTYSTDRQSPLNFYGALATNCTDFWQMAQNYWYSRIEPATKILLGEATDPSGVLKSTEYYASTVEKSAKMNSLRMNISAYDAASVISGMNTWFTERNNWIDKQIAKVDINKCTVANVENQTCTGSPVEPALTVTYNGAVLEEGVDYTVEYSNNISAGKNAVATLTGHGLYEGTKTVNFTISTGALVNATAVIPENAYAGDTVSVNVYDKNSALITNYINYQWYKDGTAIDGANEASYTVGAADAGSVLKVKITGDGMNFSTLGPESNGCTVLAGERPTGYSKTIASWNYDYTANSAALVNSDTTGTSYYYMATGGERADSAQLSASVNAKDTAEIKWSGSADTFANDSTSLANDQSPVMGTSKTNNLAWGEYPYFETTVSTLGFENIKYSAKLGGTKKGPRDWKVQYSLDGINYTDVDGAVYTITANKAMQQAFADVQLPAECDNQSKIYIRAVVCADIAINGANAIISSTSGDASINNVKITGASTAVVTKLEAPVISSSSDIGDSTAIYDSEKVIITDSNGGADVYYSINGSGEKLYDGEFSPFNSATAKRGDTVTITAYAKFNDIVSESTTAQFTFAGVNISQYSFDDYSKNVYNGAVFSNGGVYGESGRMTAYTDGKSQYVPLWNMDNGAYSVAPDDGALWSADSGFRFEISTAGYDNVGFTCKAYTTSSGPNSVSLQYSIDGSEWKTVSENVQLSANAVLEQAFYNVQLPAECSNLAKLYIRLATTENLTHGSATVAQTTLHNNLSKGNLYINDVVISGEDNGTYKMPYTNKSSNYFGATGTITYHSPSNVAMQYSVVDYNGNIVESGAYPELGIALGSVAGFSQYNTKSYTVSVWAGDDDDRSLVNTRKYYYKGTTVTEFNYNDSTRPLTSYLNADSTQALNTAGTNEGRLSMFPDSKTAAALSYTNTYGVKVSWAADNIFTATKNLDVPQSNGYWLIETSSIGYTNLTLNLDQLSSNKGPRDWGIAYSTDGSEFTYVANSNVRAISNDSSSNGAVETYNNFALPSECDNQEKLYIKIFINGGESIDGNELDTVIKGNTGIDNVELSGIAMPKKVNVTVTPVALEKPTDTAGTYAVDAKVIINGTDYTTENGSASIPLNDGEEYTAQVSVNGTFVNTVTFTAAEGAAVSVPVVCLDMNGDNIINVKDYAIIDKTIKDADQKAKFKSIFPSFLGTRGVDFTYIS